MGRRSVLRLLGVAALGLVASCRSGKQQTAPTTPKASTTPASPSPQPAATATRPTSASASPEPTVSPLSPDQLVAQRVAAAEQALLAAYDAVAVAHPELAGRLAPFRADHAAHLQGLVPGATPPQTTPSNTATASNGPASSQPSSAASVGPPLSSPPASTAILHQLADLERSAAAARLSDVATTKGSLARLVASIGGCEAAHAALLSVAT
jgi:hypothetical protein